MECGIFYALKYRLGDLDGVNRALLRHFLQIMLIAGICFDMGDTVAFDLEYLGATLFAQTASYASRYVNYNFSHLYLLK
jgi:hypothetical protein